jgi:hypothetical protein
MGNCSAASVIARCEYGCVSGSHVHNLTRDDFKILEDEVAFGGLNRDVPQEELDLLQLASRSMAEPSTGPPQIVRHQLGHTDALGGYLGCKQRIRSAVNDRIGIEPNPGAGCYGSGKVADDPAADGFGSTEFFRHLIRTRVKAAMHSWQRRQSCN